MATSGIYKGTRVVGDYIFGKQIGQGSFSVVWHARHRIRGTEVAVKEIAMERLSKKLQDSLMSEIVILKKIVHPNIIALYDLIEVPGRIYLVLEYCRGGDLSMYIQRHGSVPEETAKHFMQQLAAGLQVLRENNLIHRDLKPQNLLLTTFDDDSVLKIADFGFARSLQPRGLAETLCGSPLYMAPEIMQLQKYDAKADLWSVGAILYQLVTGKTPFTGSNQIQLLQNIIKSTDLRFPHANILSFKCIDLCQRLLRRNPVERLTFEEFFNHQFLAQLQLEESLSRTSSDMRDAFPSIQSSPARPFGASSQEDCLPFILDDESNGQDAYSSLIKNNRFSTKPTYGFFVDNKVETNNISFSSKNAGVSGFSTSPNTPDITAYGRNSHISTNRDVKETSAPRKDIGITDSLEFIDQEYVIVPVLPLDTSSSSISAEEPHSSPGNFECSTMKSLISNPSSAPVPILGEAARDIPHIGSTETSGISPGSADITKQHSSNCMARIRSLQQYASVVSELVKDEVANERLLEAFSIQLVLLSLWKQALHICHSHVTSAVGSSSNGSFVSDAICLQIEREFLFEVEHAEELAKDLGQVGETTEMPDAIELIFQYALTFGRHGAVDEMMENAERAATRYSKSMCLLHFLLVEASSLLITPPVTLTDSDRVRLRSYMDVISSRHVQSMS